MFNKKTVLVLSILAASISSNALDIDKKTKMGVYGEIDYASYGNNLNDRDNMNGSFFNVYANYKTKKHISVNLDFGYKNRNELFHTDDDDWKFNFNNVNFEYHDYSTNTYAVVGRQFTPIGINYDNPLMKNELFATENPIVSSIDGLNFVYENNKNTVNLKASGFIGTRLDDVDITTSYGGNIRFGNSRFGFFNFGYMNNKIDGTISFNNGENGFSSTDNIDVINYGYMYDNHNLVFLVDYNSIDYKYTVDTIYQLKSSVLYRIGAFSPYFSYEKMEFYKDNDFISLMYVNLEKFGMGLDYKFPKNFVIGTELSHQEYSENKVNDIGEVIVDVYFKYTF